MHREDERNGPGESAIADAIRTLEAIVEDRAILADLDPEIRRRLMEAAGRVSRPDRAALRTMAKALRRKDRDEVRRADEAVLDATGIRIAAPRAGVRDARIAAPASPAATEERELQGARKCYVCKARVPQRALLLRLDVRAVRRVQLREAHPDGRPARAASRWSPARA